MVAFHFGFDTYGRVKTVGTTPVVTRFFMISSIPIVPLESYYFAGEGVPEAKSTNGFRLARLSFLSVIMAYARGVFGVLAVLGFIALVAVFASGPREVKDGRTIQMVAWLALSVGIAGGALTYYLPFQTSRRERQIRLAGGLVLGIYADLALVREDVARAVLAEISKPPRDERTKRSLPDGAPDEKCHELLRQLVMTRAKIALGEDRQPLEGRTEDLLHQFQLAMGE
jgi:hypothetical protein